jgi:hypothetical protein
MRSGAAGGPGGGAAAHAHVANKPASHAAQLLRIRPYLPVPRPADAEMPKCATRTASPNAPAAPRWQRQGVPR